MIKFKEFINEGYSWLKDVKKGEMITFNGNFEDGDGESVDYVYGEVTKIDKSNEIVTVKQEDGVKAMVDFENVESIEVD